MSSQCISGEIKHILCDSIRRGFWKLPLVFSEPHLPFPFADFALNSFVVINLSPKYDYMLNPISPLNELMKFTGDGLGGCPT